MGSYDNQGFYVYDEYESATPEDGFSSLLNKSAKAMPAAVARVVDVRLGSADNVKAAAASAVAGAVADAGAVIGLPTDSLALSGRTDLPLSWTRRTLLDPISDAITDAIPGTWQNDGRIMGVVPLLGPDGRLLLIHLPTGAVTADGATPFTEIKLGRSVRLREVVGARGARLEYTSRTGREEDRPYMEVNAHPDDLYGDVTAGYQVHVVGNGSSTNEESRVYWFLESHGLSYTQNGHADYEGWFGMGVANRANGDTPGGMGRAFIIGGGGRPALGFPFAKPYVELMKNTAFIADDRARPAFGNGVGQNHEPQLPGTIHSGDLVNLRREGHLGIRLAAFSAVAEQASATFLGRNRGTVLAPLSPLAGDHLGRHEFGTVTTVSPDYVHVPNNGTDPRNRKVVTAELRAVATEAFTPGTKQGTRLDLLVTPAGSATPERAASVESPTVDGDTALLVQVRAGGVNTTTRVTVGAPNSGGPGLRALVIPN